MYSLTSVVVPDSLLALVQGTSLSEFTELLEGVRDARLAGVSRDQILAKLATAGWPDAFAQWYLDVCESEGGPVAVRLPDHKAPQPMMYAVTSHESKQTGPLLKAQPFLPRISTHLSTDLNAECDRVFSAFKKALDREGVDALVLRSDPFVYPSLVVFESWLPTKEAGVTERTSITVSMTVKPFHEHEIVYSLHMVDRGASENATILELSDYTISALVRRCLRRGSEVELADFQLKRNWYERGMTNKLVGLKTDPWTYILTALILLGLFTFFVTFLIAIVISFYLRKRELTVRSPGKPEGEPRTLVLCDSWHAVMFSIGSDAQNIRSQFGQEMLAAAPTHAHSQHTERIWHRGLDGIEEREQFVISSGRGLVFCQAYQYGNDLFVGWDAYLNKGCWVEEVVGRGIDRITRRQVELRNVVPGVARLSEYDWVDLNCLTEWTHTQLTRLVKQLLEERRIEQEIDFKITRSDRQGFADRLNTEDGAEKEKKKVGSNLLKRVG